MATHKFGKLKINRSEDGLAFRFGEGKIHRLGFGKKRGAGEVDDRELYEDDYQGVEEEYDQGDYTQDEYSGRFAQPSGGRVVYEDDYDGGYEDGYDDGYGDYDDGYQEEYDDRDYDDREYDDGYDEYDDGREYDSEGYYDEDGEYGEYDDRYSDEDAEGYDDASYAEENAFLRYADEHIWLIFLLLVVFPPLGIYLLWNRRLFERPIRLGVSIASAIIFVLEIILIISLLSGGGDKKTDPQLVLTTPRPTAETVVEGDEDGIPSFGDDLTVDDLLDASGAQTGDASGMDALLTPAVTPTPLPGGASTPAGTGTENAAGNAEFATGETVFTTAAGTYYHKNRTCANIGEGSVSIVTLEVAQQQSKAACPLCYPNQEEYFATANGTYYHVDYKCSGMNNASMITKEAAVEKGKIPCPVCITKEVNSITPSGLKYADASTKDKSGMTVYATSGGRYFHVNETCSGMKNAVSGSLLQAMLSGKDPCPTCSGGADSQVWATKNGKYYHNSSDCSGMEGANKITVAEAMILGKTQCSKCWTNTVSGSNTGSASGVLVYGTKNGKYYHTNSTCSGMSNASRYTLDSMVKEGRPACPVCATGASTTVFATSGGTYYHSNATCSGMKGAKSGSLAQALAKGYKRCPSCWAGTEGAIGGAAATATGNMVYCTQGGTYYHTKSNCSGMSGASQVDIATALSAGKKACPSCASAATKNVYSTDNGRYYHMTASCSGMSGAKQRPLEQAISLGQSACPTCLNNYKKYVNAQKAAETGGTPIKGSDTYRSGTSGIKVYATATSKHYHTSSSCSGMTDASKVTLETALNYGKTGCSKCASSANTTVYAVKGSKYYHNSKTCAGSGASRGTRAEALAYGFDACPYCVSKSKAVESSNTYKPGKSGIKVYASISGKYYHTDKVCAGSSASRITLETALNYSKKACPSCIGGANVTVYCNSSDNYYHSSKTCAGSNAVSGSFAKALALGKKECPVCIGGSEAYEESDIKYSAPGDTKVYIDPGREMLYYHAASRCNDAGLSGGVGGNLEFALEWGYKACPFCNPPTSVA